ncbi:MAG: hypothetical protein LUO82_06340 [Methanomicrobiales archaeon]|nr:hypothetical protein [Methanomicrobiales archaeon]
MKKIGRLMKTSYREKKRYIGLIARIIAAIKYQYHSAERRIGKNLMINSAPKNIVAFVNPISTISKLLIFLFAHDTISIVLNIDAPN